MFGLIGPSLLHVNLVGVIFLFFEQSGDQ